MGFLPQLLTAVALQTLAQLGLVQGQASALWGLLLLPAPYLIGSLSRRSMLAGHFRRASVLGRLLGLWSVAGFGILVLGTTWLGLLRRWSGSPLDPESWPEPALILAFAPFVILQVLCIDIPSARRPLPHQPCCPPTTKKSYSERVSAYSSMFFKLQNESKRLTRLQRPACQLTRACSRDCFRYLLTRLTREHFR